MLLALIGCTAVPIGGSPGDPVDGSPEPPTPPIFGEGDPELPPPDFTNGVLSAKDQIYSFASEPVLCSFNIDDKNELTAEDIDLGVARAHYDKAVLHIYAHSVPTTVALARVEQVLAAATKYAVPFVTYREIVEGEAGGAGIAFSFDDRDVAGWNALRALFAQHGARITFFVTRFHTLKQAELEIVRALEADGHDIEYHATNHRNARDFVATSGGEAYISEDIIPDLENMQEAGFNPVSFGYPFGARTAETDALLGEYFPLLRASSFNCPR
ncbi:MAG: polysaccharide deacetylase family protein [Kofleriaceae bacterium]